jgi:hypothetical protein
MGSRAHGLSSSLGSIVMIRLMGYRAHVLSPLGLMGSQAHGLLGSRALWAHGLSGSWALGLSGHSAFLGFLAQWALGLMGSWVLGLGLMVESLGGSWGLNGLMGSWAWAIGPMSPRAHEPESP